MSSNTIYFITGASRGLGRGLVATYLARPNSTVIAAVRDPADANASSLADLPRGDGSQLLTVALDAAAEDTATRAVASLREQHAIERLDVVVAAAGISQDFSTVATMPLAELKRHVAVNGYGPILLFQAVLPLLEQSAKEKGQPPKFVYLGTAIASIGYLEERKFPLAAYGASKVMAHWAMRKAHFQHENLVVFTVEPGYAQTEMGNSGAKHFGLPGGKAFITVDDSVAYLTSTIDGATRDSLSGRFPAYGYGELPW